MELVTQLVAGSTAVGGVLVVRRWLGWRPGDDGAGEGVRRRKAATTTAGADAG